MEICCCHFLERLNCSWLLSDAHFKAMNPVVCIQDVGDFDILATKVSKQTDLSSLILSDLNTLGWTWRVLGVGTRITSACRNPMTKLSFNFFLSTHVSFFGVSCRVFFFSLFRWRTLNECFALFFFFVLYRAKSHMCYWDQKEQVRVLESWQWCTIPHVMPLWSPPQMHFCGLWTVLPSKPFWVNTLQALQLHR